MFLATGAVYVSRSERSVNIFSRSERSVEYFVAGVAWNFISRGERSVELFLFSQRAQREIFVAGVA